MDNSLIPYPVKTDNIVPKKFGTTYYLIDCENCICFGFPCLNCAYTTYGGIYGPGFDCPEGGINNRRVTENITPIIYNIMRHWCYINPEVHVIFPLDVQEPEKKLKFSGFPRDLINSIFDYLDLGDLKSLYDLSEFWIQHYINKYIYNKGDICCIFLFETYYEKNICKGCFYSFRRFEGFCYSCYNARACNKCCKLTIKSHHKHNYICWNCNTKINIGSYAYKLYYDYGTGLLCDLCASRDDEKNSKCIFITDE